MGIQSIKQPHVVMSQEKLPAFDSLALAELERLDRSKFTPSPGIFVEGGR